MEIIDMGALPADFTMFGTPAERKVI